MILLTALTLGFLTGDVLLKHIVNRPRPFTIDTDIVLLISPPSGASFLSTHSVLAAAATTVLLIKKRILGIITLVLTLFIAFSRLYLYVHNPTDVLCGLPLGVLCGTTSLLITKAVELKKDYQVKNRNNIRNVHKKQQSTKRLPDSATRAI